MLETGRTCVLGLPFEHLFNARFDDLGRFVRAMPGERRAVTLAASGRVLFLHAVPPLARYGAGVSEAAAAGGRNATCRRRWRRCRAWRPPLDQQIRRAARLVDSPVSLLVTGETGSGKETAKAVHDRASDAANPSWR